MTHFTIGQWAEFVHGVDEPAARAAMITHLARCARCRQTVETLRTIADLARREAAYGPPVRAVRYAQALYSRYRPETSGFTRLVAELVHDTATAPLPVGLRTQDRLTRHLLYQAGRYQLDLQLEHQPSGRVTLIGQLADRDAPAASTADVPVWLMERGSLIGSALCNQFGEFRLEYAPGRNLRLRVPVLAAKGLLEVPLGQHHSGFRKRPGSAKFARSRARRRPAGGR